MPRNPNLIRLRPAMPLEDAHRRPIVLVLGPTAGGKTSLSIELANRLPGGGTCLGADSMQIYRGMDIGTAKPTPEERATAPHDLFDLVAPDGPPFTVADWLEAAETSIAANRQRGRWPIVVGGTNLYVQNLLFGMDAPAPTDPTLRAALDAMSDADLRDKLEKEAPGDANRIHANDRRRTIRALERAAAEEGTSTTARAWDGPPRDDFVAIGLDWPVDSINRRINARVKSMAADGLIDEVRALHDANRLGRQAREALGYREIVDHIEGRCSALEAFERIKIGTRRFAKQQRTWLRRFRILPRTIWLSAEGKTTTELASEAEKHIFSTYGGSTFSTE